MKPTKNSMMGIAIVALIALSIALRVLSLPVSNSDLADYNLRWYQTLRQQGIGEALAANFSNYTPPYTYFLALATLTHDFLSPLVAIKLIPICFDLLGAFFIYKIVKLKYRDGNLPYLAAALYFTAPTVILNSAYWGQADSLYTALLLVCLYFLMTEKPFAAMLFFGLAFSMKAQSVFLLPFLGVMLLRKRIHWLSLGLIPLVYLLAISPVLLLGRPLEDALLVYLRQSDSYAALSMNAPTVYFLFPNDWYRLIFPLGVAAAGILLLRWMYITSRSTAVLDQKYLILLALISTALTPFVLPKMHDRYFYPSDVLSILLAFHYPSLWFIPILYQFVSLSATSVFLFNADSSLVVFGFLFNTAVLAVIMRKQGEVENRFGMNRASTAILSWVAAVLVPITLFGVGLTLLLTPAFVRLEYAVQRDSAAEHALGKAERYRLASEVVNYINAGGKAKFLANLRLADGSPVFSSHEISMLDDVKNGAQNMLALRNAAFAFCFLLAWFAWAGNWLAELRGGIYQGGWLTIVAAVILGGAGVLTGIEPANWLQGADMLPALFPSDFYWHALLLVVFCLAGGGILSIRIAASSAVKRSLPDS